MKISLSWQGEVAFVAENETAQRVIFDGAPEYGGKNLGMRPMEGLLSAAAACSAIDIALMLKKSRQTLRAFNAEITAQRADAIPGVFTEIHLHFILGGNISAAAAKRAIVLSVEKYCSALAMLQQNVKITHSYTIENIDDSADNTTAANSVAKNIAKDAGNYSADSTNPTNSTDSENAANIKNAANTKNTKNAENVDNIS